MGIYLFIQCSSQSLILGPYAVIQSPVCCVPSCWLQLGLYGDQNERMWVRTGTESLHLWEWGRTVAEATAGGEGVFADLLDAREQAAAQVRKCNWPICNLRLFHCPCFMAQPPQTARLCLAHQAAHACNQHSQGQCTGPFPLSWPHSPLHCQQHALAVYHGHQAATNTSCISSLTPHSTMSPQDWDSLCLLGAILHSVLAVQAVAQGGAAAAAFGGEVGVSYLAGCFWHPLSQQLMVVGGQVCTPILCL